MTGSRPALVDTGSESSLGLRVTETPGPSLASAALCGGHAPGGLFQVKDTDAVVCEQLQALPAGFSLAFPDSERGNQRAGPPWGNG